MECSGTERGRHRCWARDRAGGSCRGRGAAAAAAAAAAVAVRVDGPGGPMCKAGTAGNCERWGRNRPGSWKRSGADRGADRGLWVHTAQEVRKRERDRWR